MAVLSLNIKKQLKGSIMNIIDMKVSERDYSSCDANQILKVFIGMLMIFDQNELYDMSEFLKKDNHGLDLILDSLESLRKDDTG
jgi:hypothetical protein